MHVYPTRVPLLCILPCMLDRPCIFAHYALSLPLTGPLMQSAQLVHNLAISLLFGFAFHLNTAPSGYSSLVCSCWADSGPFCFP